MYKFAHFILVVLTCAGVSAAELAQQTVVITSKPRFEQRGQFVDLVIRDTNHSSDISWGMQPNLQFIPLSLDTNRVYTFTVSQRAFRSITVPELRRVQLNGLTIYDREVCEVHQLKMERKEVKILYGLVRPAPDQPSTQTEEQLFPHRREVSLGGCAITSDSPKTEKIYVCRECKKAYETWKTENQKAK